MKWKVCPIQGRQLRDVRKEDLFGDFRICKTYRGGGGYDKFPEIARKRGFSCAGRLEVQFVVQLYGCNLACPYCYVTSDGIWGNYKEYTTNELRGAFSNAYRKHHPGVFHLMGGAPALYYKHWPELLDVCKSGLVFHSDFMLTEKPYDLSVLKDCNRNNALYAVNIKGVTSEDYYRNTNRKLDEKLFLYNLYQIMQSDINFYLTFTNPDMSYYWEFVAKLIKRFGAQIMEDSFIIDLVEYEALK
jgi:pyruvate-formate lyase-activating enzyme